MILFGRILAADTGTDTPPAVYRGAVCDSGFGDRTTILLSDGPGLSREKREIPSAHPPSRLWGPSRPRCLKEALFFPALSKGERVRV